MTRSPQASTEQRLLTPSHGCVRSRDTPMRVAAGPDANKTALAGYLDPANTASSELGKPRPEHRTPANARHAIAAALSP